VVLGSDYPFPLGEHHPGKLIESVTDWDWSLKRKFLSDNALEFLGLDRSRFETPATNN
jgi:aminocarboxymuconate-semialdehyde decarboxylase